MDSEQKQGITIEQKYEWICQNLFSVSDIDTWEDDALLKSSKATYYFQFSDKPSVDEAIEYLMQKTACDGV